MKKVFEVRLLSDLSEEEKQTIEGVEDVIKEYGVKEDGHYYDICPHNVAVAIYKNKIVESFYDYHDCPEDLTFGRDLLDFLKLAEKAFSIGVAQGHWDALGGDPRRKPDLIKELENEETTTE